MACLAVGNDVVKSAIHNGVVREEATESGRSNSEQQGGCAGGRYGCGGLGRAALSKVQSQGTGAQTW